MSKRGNKTPKLPKLPKLLERKLYKTGQTRGADDDEIYQNRVSRSSTVLIGYRVWTKFFTPAEWSTKFEKGYIVLISPDDYFPCLQHNEELSRKGLSLGQNALVFYETRKQWNDNNPKRLKWVPAESRINPLKGQYVARIPATTAQKDSAKIICGFATRKNKGAGIRLFEYASEKEIQPCRLQLEALLWLCWDAEEVMAHSEMTPEEVVTRKSAIFGECEKQGLLDLPRLARARIINSESKTICPLCLEKLSAKGFFTRMLQAAGREVLDLTITQINLFHIDELRIGDFNHCPYNLGWVIITVTW